MAANEFLGRRFEQAELMSEAIKLEHGGHADNVAPALMGGLVANVSCTVLGSSRTRAVEVRPPASGAVRTSSRYDGYS